MRGGKTTQGPFRPIQFGEMPAFPQKVGRCLFCGKEGTEDSVQHYYGTGVMANGRCSTELCEEFRKSYVVYTGEEKAETPQYRDLSLIHI